MFWASERRRQFRFDITFRCIQLGLDEKNTLSEIGSSQVGVSEVSTDQVGQSQIGSSQVSSNEICPSQVGPAEVGIFEVGPDEVGSPEILLLVSDFGAREFARAQKQGIDISSVCTHVQFHERIGAIVRKAFGFRERATDGSVEGVG